METITILPSPFSSLSFTTVALAAAVLCYYYALIRMHTCRNHGSTPPLPPGPRGLPVVGSLPFLDPELHVHFARLASHYGPIFRIRLGSKLGVAVSSPALAREVLRANDAVLANRDVPAVARVITYGGLDILWTPNGPDWRMLRRACVRRMLGPAGLDDLYRVRRREVRATVGHLRGAAGSAVEVGPQVFLTMLNVVTSMLWGGTVTGEEEREAVGREFRELVGEVTVLLGKPNVSDFFPGLARFDLQGLERRMWAARDRFDRIFEAIIGQRTKKNDHDEEDFLQSLMKMEAGGGDPGAPFTMDHVKAILMDMVIGGTDTMSNTMEWAMAEMLDKPEIMRRAQEELDRVVGRDVVVEEHHFPKLHYLALVIKEVLRLHPALPLLVPHCPSSSTTVGGYTVPKGARVFVNVWAIHRDPSVWEDPLAFKPERFAGPAGYRDFNGGDFDYMPFGSGRRICAGNLMAERMMGYMLASLLHSFDSRSGAKSTLLRSSGLWSRWRRHWSPCQRRDCPSLCSILEKEKRLPSILKKKCLG